MPTIASKDINIGFALVYHYNFRSNMQRLYTSGRTLVIIHISILLILLGEKDQ